MKVQVLVGSRANALRVDYMIRLLFGEAEAELISAINSDSTCVLISHKWHGSCYVASALEADLVLGLRKGRIVFYDPETLSLKTSKLIFVHEMALDESLAAYRNRLHLRGLRNSDAKPHIVLGRAL